MPVLISLGAILLLLTAVVLIRAALFKPSERALSAVESVSVDIDRAAAELSALIKCKTVSHKDKSEDDEAEFKKLEKLLPKLFPEIYKKCEFEKVGERGLLFRWRGESQSAPTVLMAHYDVVSADESLWDKPPFEGIVENGVLWGRGALDTKVTMSAILHTVERLLTEGFAPKNDVYLAFGGDEEVSGHGAPDIVALFESRGIYPALVLDEGGAVVKGVFPGVSEKTALIGIAEKGLANIEYVSQSSGGHSSTPKRDTPVTRLARAAVRVNSRPFPYRITEPTRLMLDRVTRHSTFGYRIIFANLWLFSPVLDLITRRSGGDLNSLVRTTVAFTQMEGSKGMNVIPPTARLVSNQRILPGESPESVKARIRASVADKDIEINIINAQEPSRISRIDCPEYDRVASTVSEVWQRAIVSPYLMMACSDSRHWGRLSDKVYRFSPMEFVGDERGTIHGNNERIYLSSLERTVEFFIRFIKKC